MVARVEDDIVALREMEKVWVAIRDLFQREWFTRVWVFRELHLATDIMVITGLY
jgi:hypothetical protein